MLIQDLGEFGIAPKRLSTRQDFTHPERQHAIASAEERRRNTLDAHHSGVIPGSTPLHDLVVPARCVHGSLLYGGLMHVQ